MAFAFPSRWLSLVCLHIAWANLTGNRARLAWTVGGAGLVLTLLLAMDGLVTGAAGQAAFYALNSGADVIVAEQNVRDFHAAPSDLTAAIAPEVAAVPGVAAVTPIYFRFRTVVAGEQQRNADVIGLPDGAQMGTPWRVVAGDAGLRPGTAVIDSSLAAALQTGVGAEIQVQGHTLRVTGLASGAWSIYGGAIFTARSSSVWDWAKPGGASFVLVRVAPGSAPSDVAAAIQAQVPHVRAATAAYFAAEERQGLNQILSQWLATAHLLGLLVSIMVTIICVYTTVRAQVVGFGVLKALGARNAHLYQVALLQSAAIAVLAVVLASAAIAALSAVLPLLAGNLSFRVLPDALWQAAGIAALSAACAAALPVLQIARLDPTNVFREAKVK